MPPGQDCNGHGWIMGSGGSAHCMCDDGLYSSSGTGIERKVSYSNNGNLIPFYACADSSLAACDINWGYGRFNRYDAYYTGPDGQQSVESEDCLFSGTSSACPVACGLIATKLQYNRAMEAIGKRMAEGSYPFEKCIRDQEDRYGDEETAKRVCGAIRAAYGE